MACGEGYGTAVLAERAVRATGVDANPEAHEHARLKYTRPGVRFVRDLVETYSEPCDAVVFLQTIEHVQEPGAVLDHFKSILRPGGTAYVSTPNVLTLAPPGAEKSGNPWHVKEYRASEFRELCEASFEQVELHGLFHARKLKVHEKAIEAGWDSLHPRLGVTKPFYDRFTPAISSGLRPPAGALERRSPSSGAQMSDRARGDLAIVPHTHAYVEVHPGRSASQALVAGACFHLRCWVLRRTGDGRLAVLCTSSRRSKARGDDTCGSARTGRRCTTMTQRARPRGRARAGRRCASRRRLPRADRSRDPRRGGSCAAGRSRAAPGRSSSDQRATPRCSPAGDGRRLRVQSGPAVRSHIGASAPSAAALAARVRVRRGSSASCGVRVAAFCVYQTDALDAVARPPRPIAPSPVRWRSRSPGTDLPRMGATAPGAPETNSWGRTTHDCAR